MGLGGQWRFSTIGIPTGYKTYPVVHHCLAQNRGYRGEFTAGSDKFRGNNRAIILTGILFKIVDLYLPA